MRFAHNARLLICCIVTFASYNSRIAYGQQTLPLHGFVERLSDHQHVSLTEMGIHGIDSAKTNQNGDFSLNIPATIGNDFPLDFYVDDWIVYSPNVDGIYGRMPFVGFDPHKYRLIVVKPGNKILISDVGIHNLLLSATSHFAQLAESRAVLRWRNSPSSLWFVAVNASSSEDRVHSFFQGWLKEESSHLGFSPQELGDAINLWMRDVTSPIDRGLASLYADKLDEAIIQFASATGENKEVGFRAIAFTYGLQRDWNRAAHYLELAIQGKYSNDPSAYLNLAHVLDLGEQKAAAEEARKKASDLLENNLGQHFKQENQPISDPKNLLRPEFCEAIPDALLGGLQLPYAKQIAPDGAIYCEGLLRYPISLEPPTVISLKQVQAGDQIFVAGKTASITWCDNSPEPVHVRLRSVKPPLFALDAMHAGKFEWRSDSIAKWQPDWKNLAAMGIRDAAIRGQTYEVLVPLRDGAGYASDYSFIVQSKRPIHLTTALIEAIQPVQEPFLMDASFSPGPSKDTWTATIRFSKMKQGIYRVTFEEGIGQAGNATEPIYLLHNACTVR